MFEKFKIRAEAVGSEVHRFKNRTEALDFIIRFLKNEGVSDAPKSYALWADSPFLKGLDRKSMEADVPGLKFEITRQLAADSHAGISEMSYALTDTGSLVAIIGTDNILDGKAAVFTKINPGNSRFIAFITGPSRTADIERVLTIGVHGPKRLVIIFVDDMGGSK